MLTHLMNSVLSNAQKINRHFAFIKPDRGFFKNKIYILFSLRY